MENDELSKSEVKVVDVESPLIEKELQDEVARKSSSPFYVAMAVVSCVAVASVAGTFIQKIEYQQDSTELSSDHEMSNMKGIVGKGSDWEMYKVTLSVIPGSATSINTFWTDYIAPEVVDLPTDLGCDSTRNAISLYNQQMHFVDARAMERQGKATTFWYDYFENLNGDLSEFNVFQHNKVLMFVPQVQRHLYRMQKDGINLKRRLSLDNDGVQVAHLDFQVEGRIYELVGPAGDIDDEHLALFSDWSTEECAPAQVLEQTLESYTAKYQELKDYHDQYATDDAVKNFDFDVPMVIKLTIATDDFEKQNDFAHLKKFSGAHISEVSDYDTCQTVRVSWNYDNSGKDVFKLPDVVYVKNTAASYGDYSVTDFLDYLWDDQHVKFAGDYKEHWGDNWDHWLDTHFGMQVTAESSKDTQWAYHDLIYHELHENNWPVGYRHGNQLDETGNDYHFYTGYRNTFAWEWLINEGRYKEHVYDLCCCIPENNAKIYYSQQVALFGEQEGRGHEESQCGWYKGESGAKSD